MKRFLALAAALAATAIPLSACGSAHANEPSVKLTDGEKDFCKDPGKDVGMALEQAKLIVKEKHWDHDSDAIFTDQLFQQASNELDGFNPQTGELASRIKSASDALSEASLATDFVYHNPDPSSAEISDSQQVISTLQDLSDFCDANA